MRILRFALLGTCLALSSICPLLADVDSDGDGLSDFHEVCKYLTNPNNADSDGDGIQDGDWRERREFQYTVRSVVQVMKPVTPDYLSDDYQDVRVLDETDVHVELEVIHYPFNSIAGAIKANADWRTPAHELKKWLSPGPTSDWTPELRKTILNDLREANIDVEKLDDKTTVERVSHWLLNRAKYQDGFTTFATAFDEKGNPYAPEGLLIGKSSKELRHQWDRELSAAGMYRNRQRGSCSSSSIYLSGCLRAVGIPTRTILCIPLADASDEREIEMIRNHIRHPNVRAVLLSELGRLTNSWASHSFNEVYVGGRWRRLNYDRLGQNIFDPNMFGLMTHVATFRDWADAEMHKTIGRRNQLNASQDVFGGPNPYSAISIRDELGPHAKMEIPPRRHRVARVTNVHWTDSKDLPQNVLEGLAPRGRFGLIAIVEGQANLKQLSEFMAESDGRVFLETDVHTLKIGFDPNCMWYQNGQAYVYVPFGPGDRLQLRLEKNYRVVARNNVDGFEWAMPNNLTVQRQAPLPRIRFQ